MTSLLCKIATFTAALGLLAACAPPPSVPNYGSDTNGLALEMRRVQSSLTRQEQAVRDLSHQIAELESQVQLQAVELKSLRQSSVSNGQPAYQQAPAPLPQGAASAALQGEGSPTEVYLQAFGDYASGRYQAAIRGFENFLDRFPNNSYASNAQFWLGDCYFNQQQYTLAIQEFEKVQRDYPNAAKTPDALLKIAISQLQTGATDEARLTINTLSQRYPKSTATQKAQELAIP